MKSIIDHIQRELRMLEPCIRINRMPKRENGEKENDFEILYDQFFDILQNVISWNFETTNLTNRTFLKQSPEDAKMRPIRDHISQLKLVTFYLEQSNREIFEIVFFYLSCSIEAG